MRSPSATISSDVVPVANVALEAPPVAAISLVPRVHAATVAAIVPIATLALVVHLTVSASVSDIAPIVTMDELSLTWEYESVNLIEQNFAGALHRLVHTVLPPLLS